MTTPWTWPHNARAAVSLTYDDGNENNLDQAMPDLEAAGVRGTFYLQIGRVDMQRRVTDWRAAFQRGHEIGNHTIHHPCRASVYITNNGKPPDWLTHPLEGYTPTTIAKEVNDAADWIDQHIGIDPGRTFAYPCGATAIGDPPDEASYDRAILGRHPAARIVGNMLNDPASLNPLRIGAFPGMGADPAPLIAHCDAALPTCGWTVLCFHGIGGPSHTTERPAHQALLNHLRNGPFWVAPVRDVAKYVRERS